MMAVGAVERRATLRFSARRMGKRGRRAEVVHFYTPAGKVFHARCERGIISSFIERVDGDARWSRTRKTLYLEGARAEELLRKLVILAGCRQCTRDPSKIPEIIEMIIGLGEFELIFWYSKIIEEYEKKGFWGVCRVAKAFRALYGI